MKRKFTLKCACACVSNIVLQNNSPHISNTHQVTAEHNVTSFILKDCFYEVYQVPSSRSSAYKQTGNFEDIVKYQRRRAIPWLSSCVECTRLVALCLC